MSVRPRPWFAAATVSSSAAFTLGGYEFVRSASNTLFKAHYGAANLPVVMALVPLSVLAVLAGYNWLLSRLGPRRTLWWTSLLSGFVIFLCWAGMRLGWAVASAMLYLFREAYVVLLIEQYWSFLNSTLAIAEAKKYNGPITGWASVGAILGGYLVHLWSVPLGTTNMLLFAVVLVLPGAVLSEWAYRRCGEPKPKEPSVQSGHLGLDLLKSSRLLALVMFLILATQVYSTFVGLNFQGALQEAIPDPDLQTAYSGKFFSILNAVAAILQFVLAPILLQRISPKEIAGYVDSVSFCLSKGLCAPAGSIL
ncbi:MAG: hypothetical protein KDD51_06800, partial [Bdellovibrionales bacterium]|nr:hypothetical protein [Bdellovibrionales bacterium]